MANNRSKRNLTMAGVASLFLVAMIVALTMDMEGEKKDGSKQVINDSKKSVESICESTDYKDACMKSLDGANTSDPHELVQVAFQAAMTSIEKAAKDSTLLKSLQSDPRAKIALDNCQELANRALNDLKRSFSKFSNFDYTKMNELLDDLKIWISGAGTYQQTCLDGFEGVQGDSGVRMKHALNTSMELTSNALAMVSEVSSLLTSFGSSFKRRLLSNDGGFPDWVESGHRHLLTLPPGQLTPDLVIAKDGSGNYLTINEALKDIPNNNNKTFVIYIKEGVYVEKVTFNSTWTNLMVVGDGPTKTRITGSLNFYDGTPTYHTATVAALGDFFIAKDIGFENSAGAIKHQAVALRVGADKSIFFNCHMDGYQDTLYAHTYRQYYRDCKISGTIDFIFGDSAALFQNCILEVRQPLPNQQCIVTAQGRKDPRQPTGLTLQNCSFVADPAFYPVRANTRSYLGRPWKEYSRTIIMESFLDDLIHPEGWLAWNGTFGLETLFYSEFNNRGPGSPKDRRLKWTGVKELPADRVQRFTGNPFFLGDSWIPQTGVPYVGDFMYPLPLVNPTTTFTPISELENRDLGNAKDKSSYKARKDLLTDSITLDPMSLTGAPVPLVPSSIPVNLPVTAAAPVVVEPSTIPVNLPVAAAPVSMEPSIPVNLPVAAAPVSVVPSAIPVILLVAAAPVAVEPSSIPLNLPVAAAPVATIPSSNPVNPSIAAVPVSVTPLPTFDPSKITTLPLTTSFPPTPSPQPARPRGNRNHRKRLPTPSNSPPTTPTITTGGSVHQTGFLGISNKIIIGIVKDI
ncbi:esterase [Lithospermum erythrorhizon]|uniref:pectinesterase n=1 Tax=Lithospermum erythrorhizon TaxID=34254 RepID=A0AAV3R7B7_LITER